MFLLFDRKKFVELFVPILIEQTLVTISAMLGTVMVSGVSPAAVSGVGLVDAVNCFVVLVFTAVATGVTVVVSQSIGAHNPRLAGRAAAHSLVILTEAAAVAGLLLALSGRFLIRFLFGGAEQDVLDAARVYLFAVAASLPLQSVYAASAGIMRATGNTRSPMLVSLLANVAYVGVSFLCIYGFRMGVVGAGVGLIVSRIVSSGAALRILLSGGGGLVLSRPTVRPDWKVLAPVLRVALPVGADSAMFNGGKIVVQVFMSGMGTAALAANAIANSLFIIMMIPGNAMAIACMTVVGQSFGAGEIRGTRIHMIRLTLLAMAMQTIMSAAMYPALGGLISLYAPTAAAAAIARSVMIMALLASPVIWPASFITPNMLRAAGDARFTMVVSIASMFLLRVAGAWFFGVRLGWGLTGVWFSMLADWFGRCAFFVPRMLSRAWHRHCGAVARPG